MSDNYFFPTDEENPLMVFSFFGGTSVDEVLNLNKQVVFNTEKKIDQQIPKAFAQFKKFLLAIGFSSKIINQILPDTVLETFDPTIRQTEIVDSTNSKGEKEGKAIIMIVTQGDDFSVRYTKNNFTIELDKEHFDIIHELETERRCVS